MHVCVTCHITVDQLRRNRATAIHIHVIIPRCVALVFVCFTRLLICCWKKKRKTKSACFPFSSSKTVWKDSETLQVRKQAQGKVKPGSNLSGLAYFKNFLEFF